MSTASGPSPLANLRVAIFESRMAGTTAELIARQGGVALLAPALREVPLGDSSEIGAFVEQLLAGQLDVVIFETGVGVRYLTAAIETRVPRETWLGALARARVVARGPKPTAALRELKVRIDVQVPEPNTWHETLAALDQKLPVLGLRVAVQEYGKPIPELVAGLEKRGATVTRVAVYRWALPEDLAPLRAAVEEIAAGRVGAALFTSAQQIEHLLRIAAERGREVDLREALEHDTLVASVGPTTSEALRDHGLPVDIEPEHPKLGHLIAALAAGWRASNKTVPRATARALETG
jgi:uroporphyrinogen-III synthase